MAKLYILDASKYMKKLDQLEQGAEGILKKAVYEGAKVVAEECEKGIESIPVVRGSWAIGTPNSKVRGLVRKQKEGLKEGFGISKMRNENGSINVRLGFDGYNNFITRKYPNGEPNVMIARAVESGTTFREKFPFMRPAINRAKQRSIEAMELQIEKDLKMYGF